ncbi:unnamed protein product, partial [marine sediment metagenome]
KLLRRPGITGIGNVGNTLRIYVEGTDTDFPSKIDGFPVEVFKTGPIRALNQLSYYVQQDAVTGSPWTVPQSSVDPLRTSKHRPIPGGVSIGHPSITAGTHGVSLKFLGIPDGLSNNHVLAAGSTIQFPKANIGDPIYQPGPYDGGTSADAVGTLSWYKPIDTEKSNLIDAALWQPSSPDLMSDEILDIGVPRGLGTVQLGDVIQKSGRTSGYTSAEVIDVNATVSVGYGDFEADFHNQIITDVMGDPGDSGSAVLDMSPNLVGLLFAGSEYVTIHNHIRNVLSAIGPVPPPSPGEEAPLAVPLLMSNALLLLGLA